MLSHLLKQLKCCLQLAGIVWKTYPYHILTLTKIFFILVFWVLLFNKLHCPYAVKTKVFDIQMLKK
jgi:hypothetical protein